MGEIRVGLIDSNHLARSGRAMIIQSQPDLKIVFEESDPSKALNRAPEYLVDVVVASLKQSGFPGFTFLKAIADALAKVGNPSAILLTTPFASEELRAEAVLNGANDLVSLEEEGRVFLSKIRAVAKKDHSVDAELLSYIDTENLTLPVFPKLRSNLEELDAGQEAIIANFLAGLSDFESARRLDVSKLRVTQFLNNLMTTGEVRTRSQLAVILRGFSK